MFGRLAFASDFVCGPSFVFGAGAAVGVEEGAAAGAEDPPMPSMPRRAAPASWWLGSLAGGAGAGAGAGVGAAVAEEPPPPMPRAPLRKDVASLIVTVGIVCYRQKSIDAITLQGITTLYNAPVRSVWQLPRRGWEGDGMGWDWDGTEMRVAGCGFFSPRNEKSGTRRAANQFLKIRFLRSGTMPAPLAVNCYLAG